MGLEIREACYEDELFDNCGNTTIATLCVDRIKIPLCRKCIEDLTKSLSEFNENIFCYKCKHFIRNESGFRYDGTCKKKAEKEGRDISNITRYKIGYICPTESLSTCTEAELKEEGL